MNATDCECVKGEFFQNHGVPPLFFALAPIFAQLKSEKCLERKENAYGNPCRSSAHLNASQNALSID